MEICLSEAVVVWCYEAFDLIEIIETFKDTIFEYGMELVFNTRQ